MRTPKFIVISEVVAIQSKLTIGNKLHVSVWL